MDELRKRLLANAGRFFECTCDQPDCEICGARGHFGKAIRGFTDAQKEGVLALKLLDSRKVSTSSPKPV